MIVKICGLTNPDDARAAIAAGADYIGFVFFPASRRCLPRDACAWIRDLKGAQKVGVFRDQDAACIEEIRQEAGLDLVQLHGEETSEVCRQLGGRERVIKSISVNDAIDWEKVSMLAEEARILFDTASPTGGGTGRTFEWSLLTTAPVGLRFWLAGGLSAENVASAIAVAKPKGVDVASGVESSPGIKDATKITAFIRAARGADTIGHDKIGRTRL